MLAWERNKLSLHTSSTNKEGAIVMETRKGIFELIEIAGGNGVAAHNVTEIKKC